MLDIKFIRENKELVQNGAKKKRIDFDVENLISVDDKRKAILSEVEALRAKQNDVNDKIVSANNNEKTTTIEAMKKIKQELLNKEKKLKIIMIEWQSLMVQVPNIPDMSVPDGDSEKDNEEMRKWPDANDKNEGVSKKLTFKPKAHYDVMKNLDMVDLERGIKVSGFRGYILKNDGALLSLALWQFAMNEAVKAGFSPMLVPALVKKESLMGSGYLPQGEEDLYKTQDGEYLAGTGEVASMGYFMDDSLLYSELPKKIISFSPCYRREAGSHGKDAKGLIRVHEFYKVEQIIICEASHETSVKYHEELNKHAESIMQKLEIPYRVVVNCAADLGLSQVKKYDIESWMPFENKYRETHSASYFHDFQTRRLNLKYKDEQGKLKFAHSLNATLLPTPRVLAAIVENYQQEDGSIKIPKVLQPYLKTSIVRNSH